MLNITLEIPLAQFTIRRLVKRDDATATGIEVFAEPLNGSTFAGCITAFKDDDVTFTGVIDGVLELEQLNL